jgi:light-regulated signal transduction histidine kinase (bacteriophytochrome)
MSETPLTPGHDFAFDETIDLTNCDREPIHLLGAIQPTGCLFAVSNNWVIRRVSANIEQHVGRPPESLFGEQLNSVLCSRAMHDIGGRLHMLRTANAMERLFGIPLQDGGAPYDLAIHMVGELIVIEAEPSDLQDGLEAGTTVRGMISRLHASEGFEGLCREAVRQIRALTGFHRVMLYRFDHDGAGEVIAESAASFLSSFLGLRFPASDIPKQARLLYERNWLRLIADIKAEPVPIVPQRDASGQPLDLSLSVQRSVSPIHIEYLTNMGVQASMSISVIRKGKLWGLIACHHNEPLRLAFERRTAAELFGQIFSLLLESRERDAELAREAQANRVHNRLMASLGAMRPGTRSLTEFLDTLSEVLPCDGIGLWSAGGTALRGHTPTTEEFAGLVRFLNRTASGTIYSTFHLGEVHAPARDFADRAAGILAIPLSRGPRDYLIFFRREVSRSVTWAGNPQKPVALGPNGARLTPRKSFAAWRQTVEGQSLPWTDSDLQMAERLRVTLLEVVLQLADMAERERRVAQERQEILIAELNHRVRNILGLIRGLVGQTRDHAATVEEFAAMIGGRIQALARAHDQITADKWQPAPLADLILAEAAAYLEAKAERVMLEGPPVLLEPQAHTTLALVIHEMMTNAAKYGALCDSHGTVRIRWRPLQDGALEILWTEEGGPPVQPPSRKGFGTTIVDRSVPYDLGGEAQIEYLRSGVEATFRIPARHVSEAKDDRIPVIKFPRPAMGHPSAPPEAILRGEDVLLVEDSLIIALDAEDVLDRLGADRVTTASTVESALDAIRTARPTLAMLDINLGDRTSYPVADKLSELDIPFLFASGYGEQAQLPPEHAARRVVQKPYTIENLARAMAELIAPRR